MKLKTETDVRPGTMYTPVPASPSPDGIARRNRFLSRFNINADWLGIKVHMFLFIGSLAGVMPYASIIGKQIGITASLVGLVNTAFMLASVLLKFAMGSLADKFQNLKVILMICVFIQASTYFLTLYIPHIDFSWYDAAIQCFSLGNDTALLKAYFSHPGRVCVLSGNNSRQSVDSLATLATFCHESWCYSENLTNFDCTVRCRDENSSFVLSTYQFWLFAFLRILSGAFAAASTSLTDTATYAILRDKQHLYGRQRLWGTFAWGGLSPLIGLANQMASNLHVSEVNFAPGFYLSVGMTLMDFVAIWFLEIPETVRSKSLFSDVRGVLKQGRVLFFMFTAMIMGCFMGMVWSYGFWYLQLLGASSVLLGLNLAVQCFGGEIPVMFFAGHIIKFLGYGFSMSAVFAGLAVRFAVYAYGEDPWLMLPVEITHGLCFGLFYSALTLYASVVAPPGAEATLQGIFGGMFEGIGIAVGTLVTGFLFDIIGHRGALRVLFFASVAFLLFHIIVQSILARSERRTGGILHHKGMKANATSDQLFRSETAITELKMVDDDFDGVDPISRLEFVADDKSEII